MPSAIAHWCRSSREEIIAPAPTAVSGDAERDVTRATVRLRCKIAVAERVGHGGGGRIAGGVELDLVEDLRLDGVAQRFAGQLLGDELQ